MKTLSWDKIQQGDEEAFRQPVTMKGGRVVVASKALPNLTVTRSN